MKTYLYVLDTMADWEVGYLTAELNSQRYFDTTKKGSHELIFVGASVSPVTTMGGISMTPSMGIDEVDFQEEDLLVLPGSDIWLEGAHDEVLRQAKTLIENGQRVAAICGATFGLAKVGALDKVKHTSNDKGFLQMVCPSYAGGELYENSPVVSEGNLVTANGIAPLEFTKEVLQLLGVFKKDTLEAWFELYRTKDPVWFHKLMASLSA